MIVEGVVGLFFSIFRTFLSGLEIVHLPYQFINVLSTILSYGIWIVGADVFGLFITSVVSWWVIKFTVGLVIWIWELLPLT